MWMCLAFFSFIYFPNTLKNAGLKTTQLGLFATQRWVNIGQNTCWAILTQLVGLNTFTHHAGLFNLLLKNIILLA